MKKITVYTDGACSGNPGVGGWGAVLEYNGIEKEISGAEIDTTNNRMELMAAIRALEALREPCAVLIHTDSSYLHNAFEKYWVYAWQDNGWFTSTKKPVSNRDLWERLLELTKKHKVKFIKVVGHSDNILNDRCDKLAKAAIKSINTKA